MEWFELEIESPPLFIEGLSNYLFELGATGVSEHGTNDAPILRAYFETTESEKVRQSFEIYYKSLEQIFPNERKLIIRFKNIRDTGWSTKYQEFYKAQKLAHDFFLLPAWEITATVPSERIVIRMEPGQAFGTGLHPSTKLSLRLMESVFHRVFDPRKLRVIDVGTGTGILAIAARKLGACEVMGIDLDPVAVETAVKNCELNLCPEIQLSTKPFGEFTDPYELVVSNILLEAHVQLVADYQRLTKKGGYLILSGLLGSQRKETVALLESYGFGILISQTFHEWTAFLFSRKG